MNTDEKELHRRVISLVDIHSNKVQCMICKKKGLTNNIIPFGHNKSYSLKLCSKCSELYASKMFFEIIHKIAGRSLLTDSEEKK